MNKGQFAAVVGISPAMVSKYVGKGLVVFTPDNQVDAVATLQQLEGRLDEGKRRKALAALGVNPDQPQPASAARTPELPLKSPKAQKDEVELALRRLEYGQKAGELVRADDVDAGARAAVAAMREAIGNTNRETADMICSQFGVPADRAPALTRFLKARFETGLGAFSEKMAALAVGDFSADDPVADDAAAADLGAQTA